MFLFIRLSRNNVLVAHLKSLLYRPAIDPYMCLCALCCAFQSGLCQLYETARYLHPCKSGLCGLSCSQNHKDEHTAVLYIRSPLSRVTLWAISQTKGLPSFSACAVLRGRSVPCGCLDIRTMQGTQHRTASYFKLYVPT